MNNKKHKTLLIYLVYREGIDILYENYIKNLNAAGFDIEGFCITIDPPGDRLSFNELDNKWKQKDKKLMQIYDKLQKTASEKEILVLFNGANLHPEFLKELKTFNAYMCFDDPESSENLSQPLAKYFDACFVGNIASINQYKSWGCKNVFFRPMGYFNSLLYSNNITELEIISRNNNINACIFCERESPWRKERLDFLVKKIPDLYGRGKGWPDGWVSDKEMLNIYSHTKIGINIHNSTGPINLRLFALPANGIMQICDNKYFLGHIFELGKEVVGFCDIEEAPELVDFYLKNDELRKKIAVAGWKRVTRDYNEIAVWRRQMEQIGAIL